MEGLLCRSVQPVLAVPILYIPVLDIPVLDVPVLIRQVDAASSKLHSRKIFLTITLSCERKEAICQRSQ
jgi:hypothetical protein